LTLCSTDLRKPSRTGSIHASHNFFGRFFVAFTIEMKRITIADVINWLTFKTLKSFSLSNSVLNVENTGLQHACQPRQQWYVYH
jgi:hypothetical protein